ncbi:MAG: threonine synthase, partial [Chloroflexota bacterium]|nr:threonine synthase [Chloroflexota bacterium]
KHSLYKIIYVCPKCGSLLEVRHDLVSISQKSPESWKSEIDSRVASMKWPYSSGVWCMREWIAPDLYDDNIVSMHEGHSNLFFAERLGEKLGVRNLWVKLCGNSHTGSFKDLGMTVLVSVVKQMMQHNNTVRAIACASTGDTSASLAAYAAAAGIPAIVFLPRDKVTSAQLIQPISNGAHVLALDTDFDGCMEIVRKVTEDNSIYLANSINSLRVEGQKSVAIEIVRQFKWEPPDWIIVPVGNLGNVTALYKGLHLLNALGIISRMPRLVAAQAANANPFYMSYQNGFIEKVSMTAKSTIASAIQIGNPVSYEKAVKAIKKTDGIVEEASEHELANAGALADLTGLYTCPHTAVALAVLTKLVRQGRIKSDQKVVVISTANGLK